MKEKYKTALSFNSERDQNAIADMGDFIRNSDAISPEDKKKMAYLAERVRDRFTAKFNVNSENTTTALIGTLKVLGGVAAIAAFPAAVTVVIPSLIIGVSGFKDVLYGNSQKRKDASMASQKKMVFEAERFSNMVLGALENSPDTPKNREIKEAVKRQGGDVTYLVAGFGVRESRSLKTMPDKLQSLRDKQAEKPVFNLS